MSDMKHFWCGACREYWQTAEYEAIADVPEEELYRYEAVCPRCSEKTRNVPYYYANLKKMHASATGPITEDGKKKSSRNAFKHGIYARQTKILAPARYGKYSQCENCDDGVACSGGEMEYCPHYLELLLRFMAAYQEGKVEDLKEFAGMVQGKAFLTLQMAFDDIMMRGVVIESPMIDRGFPVKVGGISIMEISRHPLLKDLPDLIRTMGMDADSQKMTPKSADQIDGGTKGALDDGTMKTTDYIANLTASITGAIQGIVNASKIREGDPAFQRYGKEKEAGEEEEEQEVGPDVSPFGEAVKN